MTGFFSAGDAIEQVTFNDSTVHNAAYIAAHLQGMTGTSGVDILYGTSGNDTLSGLAGNDTLFSLGGNDTLDGGAGTDKMAGGTGDDVYIVDNAGDSVVENSSEGTDLVQSSVTYALADNVENLTLTGVGSTSGTGNAGVNVITGNSGINVLDGGAGADTLIGGGGGDTFFVDNAGDVVTAGSGTDAINSSITWDMSTAGHNNANVENLTLTGSANINAIGNSLVNIVTGNSGDNTLDGSTGADTLTGGGGNDTFFVDNVDDVVIAGSGTDTIQCSALVWSMGSLGHNNTDVENLTLVGTGDSSGTGNALNNLIIGNSGNNTLNGGAGADTMIGGAGNDNYAVDNASDFIFENANEGTDTVSVGGSPTYTYTLAANVENLTLNGSYVNGNGNDADNVIRATWAGNTVAGGAGNDTYYFADPSCAAIENAGGGTDTIIFDPGFGNPSYELGNNVENLTLVSGNLVGTGNSLDNVMAALSTGDTLIGGSGNDTYIIASTTDVITEVVGGGTDTVQIGQTYTLSSTQEVENLTLTGTAANNGTGNALGNLIIGNSGNNTLDGQAGADTMVGGGGNDTYFVDDAGDTVTGGAGTDTVLSSVTFTLSSTVENLTLTGTNAINGTGNTLDNVMTGNSAANTLDGNAGNDTYVIDNTADVIIDSSGTDTVQSSITYSLASILENLLLTGTNAINATGNSGDNVITGNSAVNILTGNDGHDTLDGGGGSDTLIGGNGNDLYIIGNTGITVTESSSSGGTDTVRSSITYSLGTNVDNLTLTGTSAIVGTGTSGDNVMTGNGVLGTSLVGGLGNDTYYISGSDVVLESSSSGGTDTVYSGLSTYTLTTNVENLVLTGTGDINGTGNSGVNVITGNSGDNTLSGGGGIDTLVGGAGNDSYIVDTTTDIITESIGGGTDTVQSSVTYTLSATQELENLTLTGANAINGTGNSLANVLTGNGAANSLDGGAGADTMIGGVGSDTYFVDNAGDVITENSGEGTDIVQSSITFSLNATSSLANVEKLTLTGSGDITGTGNDQVNVITGNVGNNTLDGGAGADSLIGGGGNDTYYVDVATDILTESTSGTSGGTDTVISSANWTLGTNFENLTLTGTDDINGTGNTVNNVIIGNSHNNILNGGGATTADTLIGGDGNDTYVVDTATDVITENIGEGTDTIQSSIAFDLSSNVMYANIENLNMTSGIIGKGNDLDNYIVGNSSNNTLIGGIGNDTLDGGTGADSMVGGVGDDVYYVNTTETVIESISQNEGTDTVNSAVAYTLGTFVENLTLTGTSIINGTGNTLNNIIIGNSAANTLSGSDGNDMLDGGNGLDHLIGGIGSDTFVFHLATAFSNIDVVNDFNKTTDNDKLDIHDMLSGYDPAHDVITNWVRISDSAGNSTVEVDRDGAGSSFGFTQIATLTGITGLTDEAALVASGNLIVS